MEIKEIIENVTSFFNEHVAPLHKITAIEANEEEGWTLVVETIEEREYMKRYAKDEMIGVYDVKLNGDKEIVSFKRNDIRYRSSIKLEE